jgi:hypothetical protein
MTNPTALGTLDRVPSQHFVVERFMHMLALTSDEAVATLSAALPRRVAVRGADSFDQSLASVGSLAS